MIPARNSAGGGHVSSAYYLFRDLRRHQFAAARAMSDQRPVFLFPVTSSRRAYRLEEEEGSRRPAACYFAHSREPDVRLMIEILTTNFSSGNNVNTYARDWIFMRRVGTVPNNSNLLKWSPRAFNSFSRP